MHMSFEKAIIHAGHRIECVTYGRPGDPEVSAVTLECVTCGTVIVDASPGEDE